MPGPIIVSACLVGLHTRYDGRTSGGTLVEELTALGTVVPVCPEVLGGLGIPRPRCRFVGGDGRMVLSGKARIVDSTGRDCTTFFIRGAEEVERIVKLTDPRLIVFKEGSPSCGVHTVDIEGSRQPGCGVTSALVGRHAISVVSERDPLVGLD